MQVFAPEQGETEESPDLAVATLVQKKPDRETLSYDTACKILHENCTRCLSVCLDCVKMDQTLANFACRYPRATKTTTFITWDLCREKKTLTVHSSMTFTSLFFCQSLSGLTIVKKETVESVCCILHSIMANHVIDQTQMELNRLKIAKSIRFWKTSFW